MRIAGYETIMVHCIENFGILKPKKYSHGQFLNVIFFVKKVPWCSWGGTLGFLYGSTELINFYLLALAPLRQSSVVSHSVEPNSTKKADVIDLTLESSSDDSDEEDAVPPLKKHCVYITKNEEMHAKG